MTMRIKAMAAMAIMLAAAPSASQQTAADAPVDRVADALAAGEAAESVGAADAMLSAARRLDRLSAHPLDGHDDLAARWRARSGALGVRDTTPPMRGRALGPAYRGGKLSAGARIDIDQIFLGGEAAVVVVVPQKGRSLHVSVLDTDQSQMCGQTVQPPKTACRWTPVFTTRFRISVTNPAPMPARYYLVSN